MVVLFCYIIIASIDFGAGFFALHSKLTGDEKKINHLISRYLNPVWEVTNVFFVFLLRRDSRFLSRVNQIFRHGIVNTRFDSTDYDIVEKQFFMHLKIMVKIQN